MGIENIRWCEDCGKPYDIGTNIPICPKCRKKELNKRIKKEENNNEKKLS